jgi:1-acyl-sn-glycerol-3-phosphate acyltransferase
VTVTGSERAEQQAHCFAREHGSSPRLYGCARALASGVLRLWFRLRVSGRENIPRHGPAIIAPNHKNFLDPFFVGIATDRHVRYMAKAELFNGVLGGLVLRLGAFPVRRGGADTEAIETARAILAAGGVVVVFPEGTRVEAPDALGSPHHGAGRLALETGTPIVPAAITGTSHLWRGALPRLKRVQLAFLPPVMPGHTDGPEAVSRLIDECVWPAVREGYGRLRAKPGVIRVVGKIEPRKLRRSARR